MVGGVVGGIRGFIGEGEVKWKEMSVESLCSDRVGMSGVIDNL